MNIVDIIIIIFILLGGVIGFKRGAIRELVSLCGFAIIVIISFLFINLALGLGVYSGISYRTNLIVS